jgi:hypothetical protein
VRFLDGKQPPYETCNGIYRYVANGEREGRDAEPEIAVGDEVWFDFEARLFNSSSGAGTLFYTNKPALIASMSGSETLAWPAEVQKIRLGIDPLLVGVADGMAGCRQGDSVALFILSDRAYGSKPMGVVPQNTAVAYVLNIRNVIK